MPITFNSFNSSFTGYVKIKKNCSQGHGKILSSLIAIHETKTKKWQKKIEIMIPMKIKSPNHPSRKKYRAPSISAHCFLTWVQADWSPIFLSFWTLLLLYWCGFSQTEMSKREPGTEYNLTSVCIFSILFSIHFLSCWQGEFV